MLRKGLIWTAALAALGASLLTPFVNDGYKFTSASGGEGYKLEQARSSVSSLLVDKYKGVIKRRIGMDFGEDQFPRVVEIFGSGRDTGFLAGTGYILADGYVLTAAHVVEGLYKEKENGALDYSSLNMRNEESPLGMGRVVALDKEIDLALVKFQPTGKTYSTRIAAGDDNRVTVNAFNPTTFVETGNLKRENIELKFEGYVPFRITPEGAGEILQVKSYSPTGNGTIKPGMSGSPVFTYENNLTGIVFATLMSEKNVANWDSTKGMEDVRTIEELISVYTIPNSEIVKFLQGSP